MMNELEMCPFCGGEATVCDTGNYYPKIYYRVLCKKCCCMQAKFYETPRKAIKALNSRVCRCTLRKERKYESR